MGYTYNWTIYGKRKVGDLNSYTPSYKQQNIVKPTSTYKPTEYSDNRGTYARDIALAKASLDKANNAKPGAYQSQYSENMNNIINQMGDRKFSYDVNSDALFQQLKSMYDEQGKLAAANASAQAAALTGGYGNSYGTTAAAQAVLANNEKLYDRIPELRAAALQQYQQEGTDMQNLYAMLSDRDTADYGKHRDEVSDWQADRSYYDTALRNLQSMNQSVWGQNETNRYNANKQAWDNYQWGENYDLDARNKALEMARNLRNDDVSYNQWADEMTESSKQNSWQRSSTDYWNRENLNETTRHNKAGEANDAYSNQTTREHYERSDATDRYNAETSRTHYNNSDSTDRYNAETSRINADKANSAGSNGSGNNNGTGNKGGTVAKNNNTTNSGNGNSGSNSYSKGNVNNFEAMTRTRGEFERGRTSNGTYIITLNGKQTVFQNYNEYKQAQAKEMYQKGKLTAADVAYIKALYPV